MRLFIGINFPEETLNEIMSISNELKGVASKGSFTTRENLHLTLAFLGEVEPHRVKDIENCMDRISANPFHLELKNMGKFARREGDIYWLGIKENSMLYQLQEELATKLKQKGFQIEDRPFKPHLTLGRRIRIGQDLDLKALSNRIPPLSTKVDQLHLMQSHRVEGRLTYTSIYHRNLE